MHGDSNNKEVAVNNYCNYYYYHVDIDECAEPEFPCHENAQCLNTMGSYECFCNRNGYTGNGSICNGIMWPLTCLSITF